ncbi:peptide chain release factor 2 [Peptococcus simiae]|uniref:peptide chain release factor 2 n=1 Tax=Peptococcus simiae TaxID=1643805 RepID=UPI0039818FAC
MDYEVHKLFQLSQTRLRDLSESLDLPHLKNQLAKLEAQTLEPDFWQDSEAAQGVMQKKKTMEGKLRRYEGLAESLDDVEVAFELYKEEADPGLEKEIEAALKKVDAGLDQFELETILNGDYDANNAIVTIHPGAGGTESQDWAEMLYRMYVRWAERHGFKVTILDYLDGDEAGLKSATILVAGENAYGYLKAEKGVHRMVRISPFDSSGRRHTSFSAVEVMPEVETDTDIDIDPKDLSVDTYRSTGAGGQHVNKTESAVRITHLPTGIVVQCQSERSQIQNRATAMKMLTSRLVEEKIKAQEAEIAKLHGDQQEIGWGSQIRSYVFHPYTMVKDHRTNTEKGNVQAVMDGDIDDFINAWLKNEAAKRANR